MSADTQGRDFGWRLHGRSVGVLAERSFKLVPSERPAEGVLDPYWGNLNVLQACLQCGTCTANCSLVGENSQFPRRQMNLFQLGQHERLLDDPAVWHCYNCGDCSTQCPSGAKPGRLMGAIRQMAVEHFAFPGFVARSVNRPQRWWLMFVAAAVFVLGVIALGGAFRPAADQVHYASMLPHLPLNVFFSALSGLAITALAIGASRAWRTYQGEPLWQASPGMFLRALGTVIVDVLAHRRFSDCAESRPRSYAHLGMFYGFLGLAGLAGAAALLIATGGQYPFPALHPLKIAGNAAAGLMILGTAYFVYERWAATVRGEPSTYFDWLLLVNLLLAGITGVLCEMFRYLNVPLLAYPAYFLHLVLVCVLLVSLPYSKLAHVCYRTLALTSRQYDALLAAEASGRMEGRLAQAGRALQAGGSLAATAVVCYTALGE
ncbi:MAG: 4Fe-4S dicluster domain-containing protein [Thermoguttaceae bacterium]